MNNSKKYIFEKLTPINDSDIEVYEAAIDFVFENDDVRNVAISGAYGAGKSSVISSYKETHSELKFVHISLAHFQNISDASKLEHTTKEITMALEGKILNQLIHQIPADRIPQSNFRVKKTNNNSNALCVTVATVIFILALMHIVFFDNWKVFVFSLPEGAIRSILELLAKTSSQLFSGSFIILLFSSFLNYIIKAQKNKNLFKKFNIQGNEIEIFEESDDSYFDKYLNEVLYLFDNVDANVIVFEDMDRFDANRIFERLREINTLVNIHRENGNVLRFFYLLKDDIFVSKDRTKFFDCIIPIVPVVDSSNSYNQFISHLRKNELFEKFDENFLQGISLYVDDMRLLKNICNEFLIYHNRLNTTELDYNKMFAMVTYKNLFPRDFSELQLNKGFVYSLFANKPRFIDQETANLRIKINEIKKRKEAVEKETLMSVSELDIVYYPKKRGYPLKLNNEDQAEYDSRVQAINDRKNNQIPIFEEEIIQLEIQIQKVLNYSLASIISRENVDEIFKLTTKNEIGEETTYYDIKSSEYFDLVKYLIRNGYIDETYADYMTYFYENSLTLGDKKFLRSITDKKAKPYTYELRSPEMILSRLRPVDFDQEETLNFILCDYLLEQKDTECVYLEHLIDQLKNNKKYAFVAQFFRQTRKEKIFVQVFNKRWPSIFIDMQNKGGFDREQLKRFSILSLYYSDDESLKALNIDEALTNYISFLPDYLDIDSPKIDRLVSRFKLLNIEFPTINYEISEKGLFNAVYRNNLYVLNFENICMILSKVLGVESIDIIRHKNYTVLVNNPISPLYKRINDNFEIYFEIFMKECSGKIQDDEDAALMLLNRQDIDMQQKQRYIRWLETKIIHLNKIIDKTIWETQVLEGNLLCSEENIMEYFSFKEKVDQVLIDFINKAEGELDFSEIHTGYTKDQREHFLNHIINCNELNDAQYTQIIKTIGLAYSVFEISDVAEPKMKILINNKTIKMNPENLVYLRDEYPSILMYYIQNNIDDYVKIMNDELFEFSELVIILDWDIADTFKLNLLEFTSEAISVNGKDFSTEVKGYILRNNLMEEDLEKLYLSYHNEPTEIRNIIEGYAVNSIEKIIDTPNMVSVLLKERLLEDSKLTIEEKINLIVAMIPHLDLRTACRYLSNIGYNDYEKIRDSSSRPKFMADDQNIKILEAFKNKRWIFEYYKDEMHPDYYKIRRRESRKAQGVSK